LRADPSRASLGPATPREEWKTALGVLSWTAFSLALKSYVIRIVLGDFCTWPAFPVLVI
jgi:hypothetical protein